MKKCALMVTAGLVLAACTHDDDKNKQMRPEFQASRVVERMEGVEKTPDYATGAKGMWNEGSKVYFANVMTLSGDSRPEACMKAASMEAKAEMLKYIKEGLTASGQLNEASASEDPAMESLIAFLSQGNLSGASVADRYWDRREESDSAGERVLRVRCAVKVGIERGILAKQLREATEKVKQGNPEVREKLLEAQKSFIENLSAAPAAEKTTEQ